MSAATDTLAPAGAPPPAWLLFGDVMHRRLFPVDYRFVYRVFALRIDLDRIEEAAAGCRWFSHNRFNLFSFHDRDHGARDGTAPKDWVLGHLREWGLDGGVARIELECFPRVLGYGFNPLSVWTCFDADDRPLAILCEVSNTFGERHGYLLHRDGAPMRWPVHQAHAKEFYVSPFVDMEADYHFRFTRFGERLITQIREYQHGKLMLVAVQRGERRPLNDANLLRAALRYPLLTFKVIAMIHWQALKIWLRGGRFHAKPAPPLKEVT